MENQTTSTSALNMPSAIIIAGLLIAGGIYFGLTNNSSKVAGSNTQTTVVTPFVDNNQAAAQETTPTISTVSIDDDAVLGDADAPVTLIEFSDYECPYCQRSFEEAYGEIKTNYIDTGKVKYVFRDLPLSFHEPKASIEANAANCARAQKGDTAYYQYHDAIYTQTPSNGVGLTDAQLIQIAADLKLNTSEFKKCVDANTYESEIQKDITDASNAGATGTPTFFVGKTTESGIIEAEILVGALPYSVISQVIDSYLTD